MAGIKSAAEGRKRKSGHKHGRTSDKKYNECCVQRGRTARVARFGGSRGISLSQETLIKMSCGTQGAGGYRGWFAVHRYIRLKLEKGAVEGGVMDLNRTKNETGWKR